MRAEQSRRREREREVRVLSRRRERERERCVRVLGAQDLALAQYWRVSETRFGRFFEGKKIANGSAMLLSWQHCASPFLQLRVGPWVKQKIRAALIAR